MAVWQRSQYHGMYEILDYGSTLEIVDARGDTAGLRRREVSRFLQDNGVSIHDHAWGDGEISADYSCQPGTPVESYKDGSKFNVSISLRETKNRGDVVEFWAEPVIRQDLPQESEWLETEIDHWTKTVRLNIITVSPFYYSRTVSDWGLTGLCHPPAFRPSRRFLAAATNTAPLCRISCPCLISDSGVV